MSRDMSDTNVINLQSRFERPGVLLKLLQVMISAVEA